jgi:hypothetical protein
MVLLNSLPYHQNDMYIDNMDDPFEGRHNVRNKHMYSKDLNTIQRSHNGRGASIITLNKDA